MPNKYSFFFSYTRADHEFAKRDIPAHGTNHNLLDCFFEQLARIVSGKIGTDLERAAFRDTRRIGMGEIWPDSLTEALQSSSTLVAIISPKLLKSENCGREMQFFMDRFIELKKKGQECHHPIIPIFWENSDDCHREMPEAIKPFLRDIQFKTEEFPSLYPTTGLRKIISGAKPEVLEKICDAIASHIVKLHTDNLLPPHPIPLPFTQLPSMFTSDATNEGSVCGPPVLTGASTTQVVYVVGNKDELTAAGSADVSAYDTTPEEWQPFFDAPGATVKSATEEGFRKNRDRFCNWGWPENLVEKIAEAEEKKSPVLLVLDRASLVVERIKTAMTNYDKRNFDNVALLTAGDGRTDEEVQQVLTHKFNTHQQTHLWTVPTGRSAFVDQVADVVGTLKRKLITMQSPGMQPAPVPSLRGPCGN